MTSDQQIDAAMKDVSDSLDSPHSRRSYAVDWNRFYEWAHGQHIDPLDVTPKVIRDHVVWMRDDRKMKRSTIQKAISVVREVYRALVNAEVLKVNPARETKVPRVAYSISTPVLSQDEVHSLLMSLPSDTWRQRRDRLVLLCLFGLGWRRAEIARMRLEDFDGTAIRVTVKGNKQIVVAVPEWLREEIDAWCALAHVGVGPIFPRSPLSEEEISGAIVYEIVTAVARAAGFPKGAVTPHAMRRTNITIAGEKGVSLKARQLAVGHSSQNVTEKYDRARDARSNAVGDSFVDLVRRKKKP